MYTRIAIVALLSVALARAAQADSPTTAGKLVPYELAHRLLVQSHLPLRTKRGQDVAEVNRVFGVPVEVGAGRQSRR
jgi:hypothetical protein